MKMSSNGRFLGRLGSTHTHIGPHRYGRWVGRRFWTVDNLACRNGSFVQNPGEDNTQ